jgi:hypothetical protein
MEAGDLGYKKISIEELRQSRELDKLSDDEANEIINTIEKISILLFNIYKRKENDKEGHKQNTEVRKRSNSKVKDKGS